MPVSSFFRVATAGDTVDGREITRVEIDDMAETYDPAKYTARIFAEHIRGFTPSGPFQAYGDVTEVKAQPFTLDDGVERYGLYVKIDATEEMVAMNKARQKIFSSVEIAPNFAKTHKSYLYGLGVTDSPSSLCTEALKLHSSRKQLPTNLFTSGVEVNIEFEDDGTTPSIGTKLFNTVKEMLSKKEKTDNENFSGVSQAVETIATSQKDVLEQFSALETANTAMTETVEKLTSELKTTTEAFNTFKAQMDDAPAGDQERPPVNGGSGQEKTDC